MSLPSAATMWRAFSARDATYAGAFFAGVRTTGVFCRPGCGARTPLRRNVAFFAEARAAVDAGFRPCRRCLPLAAPDAAPPFAAKAMRLSDAGLDRRLGAPDLRAAGLAPARVSRWFKARTGMTFQAYHRARRMGAALARLKAGARVVEQPSAAGYASDAGFRDAFAETFGAPPGRARAAGAALVARTFETPLGRMLAMADDAGLRLLEFADRRGSPTGVSALRARLGAVVIPGPHPALDLLDRELAAYFAGRLRDFATPLAPVGTPFELAVWDGLRLVPYGETRSYAEQARALGRPTAARAVGRANGRNRLAIVVPCHRVLGADGKLVGYAGGLWRKERLLALEAAAAPTPRRGRGQRSE